MSNEHTRTDSGQIKAQIVRFMQANLFFDDGLAVADDQSLLASGLIDSTSVLELIAFLEETFDIHIADEELVPANLDSINQITGFVTRKREEPLLNAAS